MAAAEAAAVATAEPAGNKHYSGASGEARDGMCNLLVLMDGIA